MYLRSKGRGKKGVATVALVLVCAFCIILPLGLFGFELGRVFLIQEELRNITDAAALAGTAALASAPAPPEINAATGAAWTYSDREFVSLVVAAETFAQNSIMDNQFSLESIANSADGTLGYTPPAGTTKFNVAANLNPQPPTAQKPSYHNAALNVILTDQNNNQVSLGNKAAIVQVQAYYTEAPVFLGISTGWDMFANLGINPTYTLMSMSTGGLPMIDLMLCFDTSGSLDDETSVAFVNRYWTKRTVTGGAKTGTPYGANAYYYTWFTGSKFATIALTLGSAPVGSQVNVFPPQNLSYAGYPAEYSGATQTGGNTSPWVFTETPAGAINPNASSLNGLRALSAATYAKEAAHASPSAFIYVNYTSATMPEAGLPPGNYNATTPFIWQYDGNSDAYGNLDANGLNPALGNGYNATTAKIAAAGGFDNAFTDLVIAPAGNFPISVVNGGVTYSWPNMGWLVESSRGNAESAAILNQAMGGANWAAYSIGGSGFSAKAGYFNAYWLYVLQNMSPMSTAQAAAYDFFSTLELGANTHFGLASFAGCAATLNGASNGDTTYSISGSGATETLGPIANIDPNYLASSYERSFPLPCIALSTSSDNFNLITGSFLPASNTQYPPAANATETLPSNLPLLPTTSTDIADSLNQCISIVSNSAYVRPAARKVIILFTDGVPNEPGGSTSTAYSDAITQAQQAGALTPIVPIYTIGLSQNNSILPLENNLLGDGQSNGAGGTNPQGIAYYSAPNSAKYYSVTSALDLETAFQEISRSLCVIN